MKVLNTAAPYIRRGGSARSAMLTTVVCLTAVMLFSTFLYGTRVLLLSVGSAVMCVVCESITAMLTRLPNTIRDFSAVVTGLVIALLLPVTVPWHILLVADAFAIFLAKGVFGGLGHNPFNPAACAIAFVAAAWPDKAFAYVAPFQSAALSARTIVPSAASYLHSGGIPPFRMVDVLLGDVPSAMGTACFAVLAACFIVLCAKGVIRWRISVSFVFSAVIFAAVFNRTGEVVQSIFWELFSGFLLFAAIFMLTDPSTAPKSPVGCWVYGFLCGLSVILMRIFGAYEEGLCFALILCNALSPTIDRVAARIELRRRSKNNFYLGKKGDQHG